MTDWKKELNIEQLAAVTHEATPLLVLAGAGSGKTKVLTYRVLHLIEERLTDPSEIVLLTFTNKAAAEMKQRVTNLSGPDRMLGFAGTFHTFGARLLRRYGELIGLSPNFVIYDTNDSEMVIKKVVKEMDLDYKRNKPGMFLHLMSRLKNELLSPEQFMADASDEFQKRLATVWRKYQETLQRSSAVDFDDLLILTVKLLELPRMREIVEDKYKHILVDEYQDTNKVQFLLTKLLATKPDNLMVVGDAAQAIYSFRGADYRNLSLLEQEYPKLTKLCLSKNYRSTQTILDAAYGVIGNNKNHPVLKLEATKDSGEKIEILEAVDEKDEAAYVVNVATGRLTEGGSLAVLYRTNAQSRAIEEALIRRKIDYKLVGGIRFYDRAEIKDLLAYLRVVSNPDDSVSWQRIETLGKRNKAKMEIWLDTNRETLIHKHPHELLQEIMDETGYLSRFDQKDEEDIARVENIRELMAVASEQTDLTSFLESVALIQSEEIADRKSNEALVTMMTIHAAKGLEFDEVIIAGLEEGLLPHSRSLLEKEDIEEERRLMYVAMTRARQKLHLTLTRSRLVFGGRQTASPSRFLSEIPEELLKQTRRSSSYRDISWQPEEVVQINERRIVPDWEVEKETKNDFDEIDNW